MENLDQLAAFGLVCALVVLAELIFIYVIDRATRP